MTEPTKPATTPSIARISPNYAFAMRGGVINPLIDASAELLALIMRIYDLGRYDCVDELQKRGRHEIEAIELETNPLSYHRVTVLALRYCLCVITHPIFCDCADV